MSEVCDGAAGGSATRRHRPYNLNFLFPIDGRPSEAKREGKTKEAKELNHFHTNSPVEISQNYQTETYCAVLRNRHNEH